LRTYNTLDKLPRTLLPIVQPHLGFRLDFAFPLSVLSAVTLGELCAEASTT